MYDKVEWFNDQIQFMFHTNIMEYDMNAASLSVAERFKLLPKETIEDLKLLPKKDRVIKTGLIRRDNKEFSVTVDRKIREVREQFIEENHITPEQLLSLHNDAIIFSSKKKIKDCINGIQFKEAMRCTSYMRYTGNIEIFYNEGHITYKGIPKEMVQQHTFGLTKYLCNVFKYIENYDPKIMKYISRFQKNYLQDQYPEFMYTPLCTTGSYKLTNLDFLSFVAKVILRERSTWKE